MKTSKYKSKEKQRNLWKDVDTKKYQIHVTISSIDSIVDEMAVYMDDLEKRKEAYGICGECNEPGTGKKWCRPCNAKRFKENFKNWTSGNNDIDELIQHSQLNAVYCTKYLEWIPFENCKNVTYITKGGFGKIYSADWPEGNIRYWSIENKEWVKYKNMQIALKSLDNSSNNISSSFLNEVYLYDVIRCYGITRDPNTKDYMMVLHYCKDGNLRDYLNKSKHYVSYNKKIYGLSLITRGLLNIHNEGKVHKDFHSGNILHSYGSMYISDLGMCRPADDDDEKPDGIYGVLPYMAPEVLRGCQYTKASDIYSFGIIMNEFISEEIPYDNIPHDYVLTVKVCKGLRPNISEDTPKLLADLIIKCWDAKAENRPTAKELHEILKSWSDKCYKYSNKYDENSEIYTQIKECEKIKRNKLENSSNGSNQNNRNNSKSSNIQTHPQAIYTSRLLNFKSLPEPVNSSDLSSFQFNSECLNIQLSELDINEINEDEEDA